MRTLILYGAEVPRPQIQHHSGWRQQSRVLLDRLRAKLGLTNLLDYRNLVDEFSFNRGDLSISLGAMDLIHRLLPQCTPSYARWESLYGKPLQTSLVFSGGGYFLVNNCGGLPSRVRKDCELLLAAGVRYAFLGVGINQVNGENGELGEANFAAADKQLVTDLLKNATFVSVRDVQSQKTLQLLTERPVKLIGDPALFLRPKVEFTQASLNNKTPNIGINIPFHGPAANIRVQRDLPQYIHFFRRLHSATGAELYFMVHFDSEVTIAQILRDAGLPVTIINGDVAHLQATYAELDMHVGGMLHSCILACSVGTPCVALAYDVKHSGFFNLMEMPELCIPASPFDADLALRTCLEAFDKRAALRTHINNRREALRLRAEAYLSEKLPALLQTS